MSTPRVLCVVWQSGALPAAGVVAERYFAALGEKFPRPERLGTWELPMWVALMDGSFPGSTLECVGARTATQAIHRVKVRRPTHVALSLMDCNKHLAQQVVEGLRDTGIQVLMGGYTEPGGLAEEEHVRWYPSIGECVSDLGYKFTGRYDYSPFEGMTTVPRLRMSSGCSNRCKFCTVPDEVTPVSSFSIAQQARSFKPLVFEYVYLDDKTFGQCGTAWGLPEVKKVIKQYNPLFRGFIVQTTAAEILKWGPWEWDRLRAASVEYVEVGLESANPEVLKACRKPHNPGQVSQALYAVTRELGPRRVGLNVMVGLPGSGKTEYGQTLGFIHDHMHGIPWTPELKETESAGPGHLAYVNAYWLSLYANTVFGQEMQVQGDDDLYDNAPRKSWAKGDVHGWFYNAVLCDGMEMLKNRPGTRGEAA